MMSAVRFQGLVKLHKPLHVQEDTGFSWHTDGPPKYIATPVERPNTPEALQVPQYQAILAKTTDLLKEENQGPGTPFALMSEIQNNSNFAVALDGLDDAMGYLTDEDAVQFVASQGLAINLADGATANATKYDAWFDALTSSAKAQFHKAAALYLQFYEACQKPVLNLVPESIVKPSQQLTIRGF